MRWKTEKKSAPLIMAKTATRLSWKREIKKWLPNIVDAEACASSPARSCRLSRSHKRSRTCAHSSCRSSAASAWPWATSGTRRHGALQGCDLLSAHKGRTAQVPAALRDPRTTAPIRPDCERRHLDTQSPTCSARSAAWSGAAHAARSMTFKRAVRPWRLSRKI